MYESNLIYVRHLSVARLLAPVALGADGVQLVDEDDGSLAPLLGDLLLRQVERVAHQLRPVAYVHLHQLRARQLQEDRIRVAGTRTRQQRLAY